MIKKHQLLLTAILFIIMGLSLMASSRSSERSTAENSGQLYKNIYDR